MAIEARDTHPAIMAEGAPIAGIDGAVIRLRIGAETYGIPLRDVGALLEEHMPAFVSGAAKDGAPLSAQTNALRSGIKALLPLMLRLLASDVAKFSGELSAATGCPPLPLPDLKQRHHDLLDYSVRYLAALILSILSSQTWSAESGERVAGPGGYVRLSGLSGAPYVATPPPGDNRGD